MFALLPSWGMANAAATLVGQNLGAGRPERAEQAVWRAALYNLVFLGCTGLLFVAVRRRRSCARSRPTRRSSRYGTHALRIISAGFLFYAYGMVLTQAFNGAGDTWTPTLSTCSASGSGRSRWPGCWPSRSASARPACSSPCCSASRPWRSSASCCSAAAAGSASRSKQEHGQKKIVDAVWAGSSLEWTLERRPISEDPRTVHTPALEPAHARHDGQDERLHRRVDARPAS